MRGAPDLRSLVRRALVVTADQTCEQLEATFRARPDVTAVVVARPGELGLIMRGRFDQAMSGPYGYGRALLGQRPVAEVADWNPLRLAADTTVAATSHLLRTRPLAHRYDDVLVDLDGGAVGTVSAAHLFDSLATQFAHRAIRDDLTGLANRAHFLDLLVAACADAGTGHDRVAVAFLDLDGMKRINDSHGHQTGDTVLTLVGRQLRDALRPGEIAARLGGDEFAVLSRLPRDAPMERGALELGRRCLLAIAARDGRHDPALHPYASVGVAVSGDLSDPQTLVGEADMAMYRAKQAGGNQVELAIGVEAGLSGDIELVDRTVAQAVEHGELRLYYQPIVRIADRRVMSMEALVRWQHPSMGLLTPSRFLPGARRGGHLPLLDRWVLHRACADMLELDRSLGDAAPDRVNVNLSAPTLATPFDAMVTQVLRETGLPPQRLRLELPEDADLQTLAEAGPRLERLIESGVRLALDDMGAGSTNLRYLSTLTVHGLKIDRAFVAGMLHNPRDHTVVKLLTDLGHGLGLHVTAEGVESAEQLSALAQLGVSYAQGYHLAEPQPFARLGDLVLTAAAPGRHRALTPHPGVVGTARREMQVRPVGTIFAHEPNLVRRRHLGTPSGTGRHPRPTGRDVRIADPAATTLIGAAHATVPCRHPPVCSGRPPPPARRHPLARRAARGGLGARCAAGLPQGARRVLARRLRLARGGGGAELVPPVHHHDRRGEHPLPARALARAGRDADDHHAWLAGLGGGVLRDHRAADRPACPRRRPGRRIPPGHPLDAGLRLLRSGG
ncbi:EAL domain-containing protein [Catellatospora sp. NEAU-YM18]|nr:EAL domain-containing protein [Catellatospora tritici]